MTGSARRILGWWMTAQKIRQSLAILRNNAGVLVMQAKNWGEKIEKPSNSE
jgi:hypothetical protein